MVRGPVGPAGLEALLRQTADLLPAEGAGEDAFWVLGVGDHRLIYASPAYARLFGHSQAKLHGDPERWWHTIHPEDRPRVADALAATVAVGAYEERYRLLTATGEVQWVEDRGFLVRDQNTDQAMIAGMTRALPRKDVSPPTPLR